MLWRVSGRADLLADRSTECFARQHVPSRLLGGKMKRIQCRKCPAVLPQREAIRLSLAPERVSPEGNETLTCYVCFSCASAVARLVLTPRLMSAAS